MDIEPQSQERRVATETASVWGIAVQVAAYAGVAMGLVGTVALVATSVDPSDTTLLLVAIAVTAVLFAAGIAISGEPISSNPAAPERALVRGPARMGRRRAGDPGGRRDRPFAPAAVRGPGRARRGRPAQEPAVARHRLGVVRGALGGRVPAARSVRTDRSRGDSGPDVGVRSGVVLGDSEGGQIAAVVLGIALLAGAVVAIRLGAGTPSEPAPPAQAGVLPAPPTS